MGGRVSCCAATGLTSESERKLRLNCLDAGTNATNSRDLIKLKEWDDAEYVVKDIEIGWMRMSDTGKNERVMTSVVIEHKGIYDKYT